MKKNSLEYNEDQYLIYDRSVNKNLKYWKRKVLLFFYDKFYFFVLMFVDRNRVEKKYDIAICAIFKNEADFLVEWIEYHKIVGVSHFYLYNNFSDDNYLSILEPYIQNEEVTLIQWPVPQGQVKAYQNWFQNYRNEVSWVSFLDIDEFICPLKDKNISSWINKYSFYPCVMINWKMFGTSGKMEHDVDKLVVEQYVVSWSKLYSVGKVFYNTDFNIAKFDLAVHHMPITKIKLLGISIRVPPINEFFNFIKWNIQICSAKDNRNRTIQINHYWSKSLNVYQKKRQRGDVAFSESPLNMDYFYCHESKNTSVDYAIFRFLIKLKVEMERIGSKYK